MSITVRSTWMTHSGGTKFYQLFHIARVPPGGKVVGATIGHYGPMSAVKRGDKRPVSGGQCKVYPSGDYLRLMEEKQRNRNGGSYEPGPTTPTNYTDGDFCTMLRANFPTAAREEILTRLGLDLAGNGMPVTDTDNFTNDPLDEPRDEPETPSEVPKGWGAW